MTLLEKYNQGKVTGFKFDNIHHWDAPDYCDAYFAEFAVQDEDGTWRDATDDEIDELNEHSDIIHEKLMDYLY